MATGPTLVTGVSGFLGWHVARLLQQQGREVRALVRPGVGIPELSDIEIVRGDLRQPQSLKAAVQGCRALFHVAADYRLWTPKPEEMYAANVDGTRVILRAAAEAGATRIVYTSTVGCIGFVPGGEGDETTPTSLEKMSGHYKRSKFLAEQAALAVAREGAPVVIVNPTAPVGDHDFKPTPTGQTIVDFLQGKMPAYVDTGLNVVDAEDVALGHLLAEAKGRSGERYILGSQNLTLRAIFAILAEWSGRPAPKVQIPYAVAYLAALVDTGLAELTGRPPRAPLEGVKMAKVKMWVTHQKAAQELGYKPKPARAALEKAAAWFTANGYCARGQSLLRGKP